jgi:biofilm PGA synthesis N-glycosyltransferase PgaC
MRLALVVMILNEEEHLPTFLDSLAAQTRLPDRAVLVDDGSTDRSADVAADFARRHEWAKVVRRPARPPERDRLASASVWASFQSAVETLSADYEFDVVAKVDADLRLTPRLLEEVEARFVADPALGLTGPYLSEVDAGGARQRLRWRPEHVGGATKFYRRECYADVFPLASLLNFDMVDEVKARSRGWRTASFEAVDGDPIHLRPHGTYDGALRGFRRWGRAEYVSGSHPLSVLYVGLQRLRAHPPVLGSLNYFGAWAAAAARRVPRFDAEVRALRRREQSHRMRERLSEVTRPWKRGEPLAPPVGAAGRRIPRFPERGSR